MIDKLRFNKGKRIEIQLLNKFKFEGIIGEIKEVDIKIGKISQKRTYFLLKNKRWGKIIDVDDIEGFIIYGESNE